jgi:hypothetical protein
VAALSPFGWVAMTGRGWLQPVERSDPGALTGVALLLLAFAGPDLGGRELPAPGVVRVEPVRVGVEPARLDPGERVGSEVGLLGPARAVGGGFGLRLVLPGFRLFAAGPTGSGSGRGRACSAGEPFALARERALEGGRLLPVAQRARGDADRCRDLELLQAAGK